MHPPWKVSCNNVVSRDEDNYGEWAQDPFSSVHTSALLPSQRSFSNTAEPIIKYKGNGFTAGLLCPLWNKWALIDCIWKRTLSCFCCSRPVLLHHLKGCYTYNMYILHWYVQDLLKSAGRLPCLSFDRSLGQVCKNADSCTPTVLQLRKRYVPVKWRIPEVCSLIGLILYLICTRSQLFILDQFTEALRECAVFNYTHYWVCPAMQPSRVFTAEVQPSCEVSWLVSSLMADSC